MNGQQENFEQLRRLLALKRYEQPPPGYFQDFSLQVIARLRAGERLKQDSLLEWLSWEAPWLQRFWAIFESRPIFAGAFGAAVCGLLGAAVLLADSGDGGLIAGVPAPQGPALVEVAPPPTGPFLGHALQPESAKMEGILPANSQDSLFEEFKHRSAWQQQPVFQPATFGLPVRN